MSLAPCRFHRCRVSCEMHLSAHLHKGVTNMVSAHKEDDQRLRTPIHEIRDAEAFYGYRRVTKALARVGRIVQLQARLACDATSGSDLSQGNGEPCIRPTHAIAITCIRIWSGGWGSRHPIGLRVADLTYVRLPKGFVYLACLLNIYSRKCIVWSLSRRIDAQLPPQAAGDGVSPTPDTSWVVPPFRPGKTAL